MATIAFVMFSSRVVDLQARPKARARKIEENAGRATKVRGHRGLIFEIREPKRNVRVAYLVGSLHLGRKDFYPLPERIENAFAKSKSLVLEASPEQTPEVMAFLATNGFYLGKGGLAADISPALFTRVEREGKTLGLAPALFLRMKPWMLAVTFTARALQRRGFRPELGLDQHFYEIADRRQLPLRELEGSLFQLRLFSSFSKKEEEDFLAYSLADAKVLASKVDVLFKLWRSGDGPGLVRVLKASVREHPVLVRIYKKLIDRRNETMAKRLSSWFRGAQQKPYFVVVGAAHLVGDSGIVILLRRAGFIVKQL